MVTFASEQTNMSNSSYFPSDRLPRRGGGGSGFGGMSRVIAGNYARTALLLGGLTALVVLVAQYFGGTGAAIAALVIMGAINLGSWWFSDRIVVAMHRAKPLSPGEAPQVFRAVQRLSQRANIPMPRIVWVPDRAPNAFATGRSPQHAVVAVTAGLLELLDDEEIEGVIAHELSHVLNRDVLISTIAATMAGAISLVARMAGWALMFGGMGGRRDERERGNPLASLLLIIVAPIIALLIQMAVSRSREYGADATGARLAGSSRGLASALKKLEVMSQRVPMRTADPATSHLYIVAPLAGRGVSLVNLLSTHPPVEERIRRLQEMT
jgi:heat shock protein HtpX